MRRLDGKVAIVTGAGSGIGEATARLMAREGASVVVADLNRTEAERVAGDLDAAVAVEVDVSEEESVVGMVNNASKEYIEASLRNYPMPRLCVPEDVAKGRLPRVRRRRLRECCNPHGRWRRDGVHVECTAPGRRRRGDLADQRVPASETLRA